MGGPIRRRLHNPPVVHLEHPQIDPLLVPIERHPGDVDNRAGPAGLLREAEAGAGCGREEIDGRDYWVRGQDLDQGRESCRRRLCGGGVLCAC